MKKFTAMLLAFSLLAAAPAAWSAPPVAAGTNVAAARININKASAAELEKLPGVGAVTAAEIVAHRNKNGNFKSSQELLAVKGVGAKTLEKIKNLIVTE